MVRIDPLAAVDPQAKLGENVTVGPFSVVEGGAVIGDGSVIGSHAVITGWSRLGEEVRVHKGAVVGTNPQDLKFAGEETFLVVGDRTVIREFVTLNRGTAASGKTVIGADCLIMAYVHVAHDCRIGDRVILANAVQMGGHVEIEDWAIIGGMAAIHQFVRIGVHTMVGGGWRVPSDIPPYINAAGEPIGYKGVNAIGLKRRGFSAETIKAIQDAYRILYRKGLNISQAMEKLKSTADPPQEVREIIRFVEERGSRGLMK